MGLIASLDPIHEHFTWPHAWCTFHLTPCMIHKPVSCMMGLQAFCIFFFKWWTFHLTPCMMHEMGLVGVRNPGQGKNTPNGMHVLNFGGNVLCLLKNLPRSWQPNWGWHPRSIEHRSKKNWFTRGCQPWANQKLPPVSFSAMLAANADVTPTWLIRGLFLEIFLRGLFLKLFLKKGFFFEKLPYFTNSASLFGTPSFSVISGLCY